MNDDMKYRYQRYVQDVKEDIDDIVRTMGCQPILFIGSGLSRRYMGGAKLG